MSPTPRPGNNDPDPFAWLKGRIDPAPTPAIESLPITAEALGFPALDPALQATREDVERGLPWVRWGDWAQKRKYPGRCIHTYTDDWKIASLFAHPEYVPRTGAAVAVEPNYSTYPSQPLILGLEACYRKRVVARAWQDAGVRLLVDLNVAPGFRPYALVGVPAGWRAYATRKHPDMPWSETMAEYELARRHAGTPGILFVVFGGNKEGRRVCARYGWSWAQARPPWRARGRERGGE